MLLPRADGIHDNDALVLVPLIVGNFVGFLVDVMEREIASVLSLVADDKFTQPALHLLTAVRVAPEDRQCLEDFCERASTLAPWDLRP